MINIKEYIIVYNITVLPTILFAQLTQANEPLEFDKDKFNIPDVLKGQPVELRVSLYKSSGEIEEMISDILPSSSAIICNMANLYGLKLVKKLLDKNSDR